MEKTEVPDYTHVSDKRIRGKICKMMSEMLDNPDENGIFPTSRFMWYMERFVLSEKGHGMKIKSDWKIKDEVSGLRIEVQVGKALDKLHIENLDGSMNRDFWFTKDGEFDGTGSKVG